MLFVKDFCDKILKSAPIISKARYIQHFQHTISLCHIEENDTIIAGVGLSKDLEDYIISTKSKFVHYDIETYSNIGQNSKKNDITIFEKSLNLFEDWKDIVKKSCASSKYVICNIKNYSNFKHRLHFCLNGSCEIFAKNHTNTHISSIFGYNDFVNFCNEEKIYIRNSLFIDKKANTRKVSASLILPNIYLDEATFVIEKL